MSASVDGENSFATHPLATSFQGSRDDEMGEESRADEDMEFDEQLVEGSLRLDDELGAENVPPGGDDVDQPETSVSPPDTAPKHASSFYSDTSFRSRQTNDGSPTVRLDAVDAAPPLQDVSISRSYADTAKAAADQAGDSPSLLSSRPLSSHLEEGESDLSNLVDASITGFPRLSSESMLPSVPEDSDTSMVMTEAADESSLLLPSSHSHSGSVGMRTPKSSAESNQSSGVDSNELSFSESFLKAEHEKMVAGLVLEDEPEEELDDADGVPKRPEEVEGDAYLDEHRASDEVSTPLNRSSSPAPQNAPTPSRAGASDASTARPADMSVGSIWHDTSFATTAWATPGWSGPSTPPGKLLSFDSPAGGTSANAGQDSSPSVQKAERRGASAAVESAAGLRSPLQDITALHSPRDSPARGRSGSIGLPDAISRSSGSPVSPRPSIRGPLPRSKPTTPSPQTPDRGLGLRLQPSPEISSRRTPDSARRTSLTTPGDHSTVSRSRYTDADTSLPLSEVFDAITELDVTHSERGTMLVERLKRAEEEARALRGTLAEVGQRSAEEQEKRELAEMELLKLNERVGRMGEEATSMCAAHQKKNEEVQALVEKLTAQLSHRSGANLETAEAETDKIRELEEALALERRQRADEQRDWQIRLAGMHQDPSTSSAHVTGEETTAQADRNREAVEEAKRLTREACERDFEIRVYVARQDATANEQRLRAELLEAQDAIRKTGERKDEGQHLHELERTVETQRLEIDLLKDQQKEHESQLIEVRQAEEARGHQLEQSREQCQEIHASLDRVQEAKDQMQVQLDGTRAELSAATEARDRLVEELEAMRDTLIASQTDEIVRLTAERDRVTRELEELRKESEAQWANAERAHDTEQTLKGEKARLEAELSNAVEKSSRADGLEEQVSRLEEDKSRLQAELEAALNLANNVDEMEERVRELEAERNSAINELQDLRDRTQETEGRLEKRIGELQTSVVKLEQERHGLLAGNDAETSALRQSVEDLSKQLQEEQRNVAALEDEKKASNVEMETLRVDFDAAAAELRDIVGLKDQLETLRTEIEDAAAAARNANDEAERLQHDLDDRKAELKAVHEELERSEQALEAARAEKRQVQEQLDATGQVHADALAKAHKEAAVVQAKFAEAQYAIAELEGQLNAARNKTESDTAPVEPEQLAAATARIDSLEASLSAARNAAESARKAQEQAEELVRQADEQRKEDLAGRGRLISAHDQLRRERDELLQSLAEVEDHVAMQERDLHTKQEALHKAQETASSALAQQDGEKVHELETELRIAQSDALARQKTHAEAAARLEECQAILSRAEEELAKFRARASFLEHEVADRGLTIVKLTKAKERLEEDNLNYGIAL